MKVAILEAMKISNLFSKLFQKSNSETSNADSQVDCLAECGFKLGKSTDLSESVSIDMTGKKEVVCQGMPFDRSKGRLTEIPSANCTSVIALKTLHIKISQYQFSWWEEKKRDLSQWTEIHMCIPCALEAEVIRNNSES
jgi:hypothetical protein